jgi:hypothetical protein
MNSEKIENFLALLYTDEWLLKSFLETPTETLLNQDLGEEEKVALQKIDRDGLQMAASSYKSKRKKRQHPKTTNNFLQLFKKVKEKLQTKIK